MKKDIFNYRNYKDYLAEWIAEQPRKGRGAKTALANAAGCQAAYVSQVLKGGLDFSLEQAHAIDGLLGHAKNETRYFLLLVQKARAGTPSLERHFQEQMDELVKQRFVLKDRLGVGQELTLEDQNVYYSSWLYAAIHVATDIPELQTKEDIAKKFGMPLQRTAEILDFLLRAGLVEKNGARFKMSVKSIHLGHGSPLISRHHSNWRLRAVTSLEDANEDAIHYSSAITLSRKHSIEVKNLLVETIKQVKSTVRESKEEALFCFSMDLFEL